MFRSFLLPACAAAIVLVAAACTQRSSAAGTYHGRNVLILSIDTLRPDHLATYGYHRVTSPALDELSRRAVTFENAFAPRSSTWPSLATMLTSLSPLTTNVRENGQYLKPGTVTIAEILRGKGYSASAFLSGSVCHLARMARAFEKTACGDDAFVAGKAVDFVRAQSGDKPFFAWVHLIAPHGPYEPPPEYDVFSTPGYKGPVGRDQASLSNLIRSQQPLSDADRAQLLGNYDGEIRFADALMASILAALDEKGLRDDTIIAFLADHGEELGDHHGYLYHSCSVYDSVLRIPLMIALPDGARSGTRVKTIAHTADVTPTLLDLAGVEALPSFEGKTLRPLLDGHETDAGEDEDSKTLAWSEWYDATRSGTIQTVRTPRWRYVSNPLGITPKCPPKGDYYKVELEELYDHSTDVLDQHNVVAEHPELAKRFAVLAEKANAESLQVAPQQMDKNLEEELRSFGYVE